MRLRFPFNLVVFFISFAVSWSGATSAQADSTTLSLGDSVFDLRVDPDSFVRTDLEIPLRNVPWIREITEVDPDLEPSVIILEDAAALNEGITPISLLDRSLPFDKEDLPQRLQPDGFRIERTQSRYIFLFIPETTDSYFATCSYNPVEEDLDFCAVTTRYAPDPKLEIYVRLYQRQDVTVPDFEAVARKVHEFVRCELDVTHQISSPDTNHLECRPIPQIAS